MSDEQYDPDDMELLEGRIEHLEDYVTELEDRCGNLFMFTKRLMTQLKKHDANNPVVGQAWDYLRRTGLSPSPLKKGKKEGRGKTK